ncbi:MAG TPA: MlaD family protein [Solirubrobacterales bacterium]|jgi:phospholipid/cholesterol/gamma-HCH transport system substrate-binding protein|nr:MlaD family protein [Solirubrobacterales bacterium]
MQKSAPSIGRILVAVGFTLSCFALLLFLWVTFGGPVPFKPESYRFTADFPEAITLAKEADVRIGGVSVGKVKDLALAPDSECQQDPATCNTTRATIEIEPQYAPISSDARAILRSKTLLGETYVELTSGSQVQPGQADNTNATAQANSIDVGQISGDDAPGPIPEGGHLAQTQVQNQTQIDEIFQGFDQQTREAFQSWMQNSAIAVNGRGLDLNDAFGNLGPFASDASDVLGTLRQQEQSLRTLVHSTGDVFAALTEHDQALAGAIVGANRTFGALASQSRALSDTFKILPTFENESRLTLDRLKPFAEDARPVFHDLRPVARDLSPTLHDVRRLSPYARKLFRNFDPLIKASSTGLPSLRSFVRELRPVMDGLDPFLANFNPLLRWLDYQAPVVGDFLSNPSSSTADFLPAQAGQNAPLHLSRQMTIFTAESASIYQNRLATNRGNGYLQPFAIGSFYPTTQSEIFPSHDCSNTFGGQQVTHNPPSSPAQEESGQFPFSSVINPTNPNQVGPNFPGGTPASPGPSAYAACTIAPDFPSLFGGGKVPVVSRDP